MIGRDTRDENVFDKLESNSISSAVSLAIAPPLQARSQRTFDAILEATEHLLKARPFEEITIATIIDISGVSTGSFYARFASKEALLPVLYRRYEDQIVARGAALLSEMNGAKRLSEACGIFVRSIGAIYRDNRNLMRAVTELARKQPDSAFPLSEPRKLLHRDIEQVMLRAAGAPAEAALPAVRTSQFMAVCTLREAILYPHAPFAALAAGGEIEASVAQMMTVYIQGKIG